MTRGRGIRISIVVLAGAIALALSAPPAGAAEQLREETIATGGAHACAIAVSGRVICWGNNFYGQLGRGISGAPEPVPGLVDGIADAEAISGGMYHTCAIREGGQAVCWGRNQFGQLGDGTTEQRLLPTPVSGLADAVAISAGATHTCAIRESGQAVCWGLNEDGEVGDGTTEQRLVPTPVSGLADAVAISAATNALEGSHSCAIDSSNEVLCWGRNQYGQLGDGTEEDRLTPTSASGLTATQVSAGLNHSCAIDPAGQAHCWGSNSAGQTGDEANVGFPNLEPFAVPGLDETAQISAGGAHTCAIAETGEPFCWGWNIFGQLGDGTEEDREIPTPVQSLAETAWISAGPTQFTCAAGAPGEGLCWGENANGQLGDGTTENRSLPVPVLGFEDPEEQVPVEPLVDPGLPQPTPTPTTTPPPTVAPPLLGVRAVSIPVSGKVLVRRPGSRKYVRLTSPDSIPIGSLVDARKGKVRIVSADGRGGTREADFYGGVFKLLQGKAPGAVTEVRLAGPLQCGPTAKGATASAKGPRGRLVWGSGVGAHRSTGRFSSATVRGTRWLVHDRCDNSTLTRVAKGSVTVRDFAKRSTALLRKGQSYVAKPPRRP